MADDARLLLGEDNLYSRNAVGFLVMGLLNNLFYCVVMSAAQSLCLRFGYGHLTPLVIYMNICMGMLMLVLNSVVGPRFSYTSRIVATAVGQFAGLSGVVLALQLTGVAPPLRFGVLLGAVCCIGAACAFGETVALGYFERFPPRLIGCWASGTGGSGVAAALLYWLLQLGGLGDAAIFSLHIGFIAVYLFAYFGCIREYPADDAHLPGVTAEPDVAAEADVPEPMTCERIRLVSGQVWWLALQLLLVYMFEYACQNAAAYVQPPEELKRPDCLVCQHFYVLCQLTYQLGVLISRSSLRCIQIRWVGALSVLQGLNMAGWLLAAKFLLFGRPPALYFMLPWMFYVGLLGGASYVNVYYLLLTDGRIHPKNRALAMNLGVLYTNIGLNSGTLLVLLLSLTAFGDRSTG